MPAGLYPFQIIVKEMFKLVEKGVWNYNVYLYLF